jgi:hypothetical protein
MESTVPFNLLLLPLLGGFIFTRQWNRTKYHHLRSDKERLILLSATFGLFFLIFAFSITLSGNRWMPQISAWWHDTIPFEYSGTALLAFLTGAVLWIPLNKFCDAETQRLRVINEDADRLELLLQKAMEQEKTVSATLKNGKVYFGWVVAVIDPSSKIKSVGILPTRSGYRDNETKNLHFTQEYGKVYDQFLKELDAAQTNFRRTFKRHSQAIISRAKAKRELKGISRWPSLGIKKGKKREFVRIRKEINKYDMEIAELHKEIGETLSEMKSIETHSADYETIIPISEICILSIYHRELYEKFFTSSG